MGEKTRIAWCDYTFNGWIGCTKVSAGCKYCYAERENNHYHWNPAGWGPNAPRKLTSDANWKMPLKWNKAAAAAGVIRRVFCSSLADVFDPEVSPLWKVRLFSLIDACKNLEWLLLTKRPENIKNDLPWKWIEFPPENVRLMVTAENQEMADRRIPILLDSWHGKNGISVEPMLSNIELPHYYSALTKEDEENGGPIFTYLGIDGKYIDWVICGGESGTNARPMHPDWARSLRDQCAIAGVPFLFKQWGEWSPYSPPETTSRKIQVVENYPMFRLGKENAGRLLDGREWMEFPK